jgi:hypothetical protein
MYQQLIISLIKWDPRDESADKTWISMVKKKRSWDSHKARRE